MNDFGQIVGQAVNATTFQTMPILWTVGAAPPTSSQLRSTRIDLSARLRSGLVTVTGAVTVKDESDSPVSGAVVSVTWTRPGGAVANQSSTTDSKGVARFTASGGRGTYTLSVTTITKTGYTFDPANSVLSKSITK